MGGSASTEIGGVRVFKVHPGSPASECGLEVFFDLIVEINGTKMDPNEQSVFATKLKESKDVPAKLTVFNIRGNTTREVMVTPREWAGSGLLGATVRYDIVDLEEGQGIRVLEVFPNSPAAHAGLVPFQDYILGTSQAVFHDIDELVESVTNSIGERLAVNVYNADSETVREVSLVPNHDWGGDGCIGCDIGTGMFHKIPAPRRAPGGGGGASAHSPVAAPGAWAKGPVQGLPPPAYPPGTAPPAPKVPAAPPAAAAVAPAAPGAVPYPSTAASVPPAPTPSPPVPVAAPTSTLAPAPAPGVVPPAVPPPGEAPGKLAVQWPPPARPTDDDDEGAYAGASPDASQAQGEWPRAPPSTPLNVSDAVPPVDLSAVMDPSKYANMGTASPALSPGPEDRAAAIL